MLRISAIGFASCVAALTFTCRAICSMCSCRRVLLQPPKRRVRVSPDSNRFKNVKQELGFTKAFVPHIWRHSFATHMLLQVCDLRTLQRLLGHASIKTTEIHLHVIEAMSNKLASPLDRLNQFVQYDGSDQMIDSREVSHAKPR